MHGQDYLVYAYLQLGQDKNARAVVDDMIDATELGSGCLRSRALRLPLRRRATWWNAAIGKARRSCRSARASFPMSWRSPISPARSARRAPASPEAAKADIAKLAELRDKLRDAKDAYWAEQVDIQWQVATAWMLYAEGKHDEALKAMSAAADAEDKTEKSAGHAGSARAGARTLWRHAARSRHGQGGACGVRSDDGEGAKPLQWLCRRGEGRAGGGDKAKAKDNYEKLIVLTAGADSERPRSRLHGNLGAQLGIWSCDRHAMR